MSDVKRADRVATRLREELARALLDMSDPRLTRVLVSRVRLTDDLQLATAYVRLLEGADSTARKSVLRALEGAAGKLRREITEALKLRVSPKLRFFFDEGLDAEARVDELLHEISTETRGAKGGGDAR